MVSFISFNTIIAGRFFSESIINLKNQINLNVPGGNALYAAAGFALWNRRTGIITKVCENQSMEWVGDYQNFNIDTTGIIKYPGDFEDRAFYKIIDQQTVQMDNPQKHFAEINMPFPKALLGYAPPGEHIDSRTSSSPYSIQPADIPKEYLKANNLLLCPIDYYSHSLIPPFFRSQTSGNVILCASDSYMHPSFCFDIPPLLRGISAFLATEEQVRALFIGKSENISEILDWISNSVDIVCIFNTSGVNYLWDSLSKKKYEIPSYQTEVVDMSNTYAAFCGGFSAGFTTHFDPLPSILMGIISASIKIEGSTPLHMLKILPELAQARLEALRESVKVL